MTTPTVVRVGLFALAIVALGFVPEVSGANPASTTGLGDITVSGNGDLTVNGKLMTFSFNATQKSGVVTGQAQSHDLFTGVLVDTFIAINCLSFDPLVPNTVVVTGTVTQGNFPNIVGQTRGFKAEDNSKVITRPPDRISRPALLLGTMNCHSNFIVLDPFSPMYQLDHGSITIGLGTAAGGKGSDDADDDEKGEHEGDHQGKHQGKHQSKHQGKHQEKHHDEADDD